MEIKASTKKFDKSSSLALKGMAILLMLFHHNFRLGKVNKEYGLITKPFRYSWVIHFASYAKICVPIFVFISGYGLYISYTKKKTTPDKWTVHRLIRTFSGYWFIWALSSIVCEIIDGRFTDTYMIDDRFWTNIVYAVIDALGLSQLFNTPILNGTWWYMSVAFVLIIIVPIILKSEDYLIVYFMLSIALPRAILAAHGGNVHIEGKSFLMYVQVFIFGMICSKYDIVNRIINAKKRILRLAIELILLFIAYNAYREIEVLYFWEIKFVLMTFISILFFVEFIDCLPIVRNVLQFLGRHSMNIFLTHTFIRSYYLQDFIYSFKHFILITLVLIVLSLLLSIIVEALMKLTRYNKLIDYICERVVR